MKNLLLILLFLPLSMLSQEKTLKDGWYLTHNVTKIKKAVTSKDDCQWVYVKSGVIKSIGYKNKLKNRTNSLEENFHQNNIDNQNNFNIDNPNSINIDRVKNYSDTNIEKIDKKKYLSGGVLKLKKYKHQNLYEAKITYEYRSGLGKTRVFYYSIKA
jgi:hypothetical protein